MSVTQHTLHAELDTRLDAVAQLAVALVELEQHPGLPMLGASNTGLTERRCAAAKIALADLWRDFTACRTALDAARALGPSPADQAELRLLLTEESIEVDRSELPALGTRGPADTVDRVTLAALFTRMQAALDEVADVVVTCDRTQRSFVSALVPLAARLREVVTGARDVDPEQTELDAATLEARLAELERTVAHDPLALADRPAAEALRPLQDAVDAQAARCAELTTLRAGWASALAAACAALDDATAAAEQADRSRQRAQQLIAGAQPVTGPDRLAELRGRLSGLAAVPGWRARRAELAALHTAIDQTMAQLRRAASLADGLLERRGELRGRFEAYQAKAVRLGLAERPDMLAASQQIREILWSRPCDLAAATRALLDYQQRIRAEEGSR